MENWIDANEDTFREVLNENSRVFVEFTAPWCGACTQISPIMEDLAKDPQNSHVAFVKVDVDEMPITAHDLDIMAVPTVHYYVHGEKVAESMGARPLSVWQELINEHLSE